MTTMIRILYNGSIVLTALVCLSTAPTTTTSFAFTTTTSSSHKGKQKVKVEASRPRSLLLPLATPLYAHVNSYYDDDDDDATTIVNNGSCRQRRHFIKMVASCFIIISPAVPSVANAFDNRIDSKYSDAASRLEIDKPSDLGHQERRKGQRTSYVGLQSCGTSPNCWCSSAPFENNPARYIPAWTPPTNTKQTNTRNPIEDVKTIMDTYEVGQNNIDGGGYKIIDYSNTKEEQYIYVQFQSYKAGYIDDFECWYNPSSKKYDVRSSSREGYSDLGVNAKRLEYIAKRLEQEHGWTMDRRKNGMLV